MAVTLCAREVRGVRRRAVSAFAICALMLLSLLVASLPAQAQTFTVLYTFQGPPSDGATPNGALVRDGVGNLYGTTAFGGRFGHPDGYGTVFELDAAGNERPLYDFGKNVGDGTNPSAGLVRDAAGNLYGTTSGGGASGMGTVFKLGPSGTVILHFFTGSPTDGSGPTAGLVRDCCGNLYGTTQNGGGGVGTVFRIDKNGNETVLRSFSGGWDGEHPNCIIAGGAGVFYGTTAGAKPRSYGTVFRVDSTGKETVLYRFKGTPDGQFPLGCLALDGAGSLYGTTTAGGAFGFGTVFKLDANGNETILRSFGSPDGATPESGVILDAQGNIYGTTVQGGATDGGIIFKLDPSGNETILHTFNPPADGGNPTGVLFLDAAGNLYGSGSDGGNNGFGHGTVFKVAP